MGSSGSMFRNTYILVFSIMANRSGLSVAHFMSHTSLRSNFKMSPSFPPREPSRSRNCSRPLTSMMARQVVLQLRASECGRVPRVQRFMRTTLGTEQRWIVPDSRPTKIKHMDQGKKLKLRVSSYFQFFSFFLAPAGYSAPWGQSLYLN